MIYVFDKNSVQFRWSPARETIGIRCLSSRRVRDEYGIEYKDLLFYDSYIAILPLVFDDVRNPQSDEKDVVVFSRFHARKIKRFVEKHRGRFKDVMVHCDAGASRSCATGAALGDHYGFEYEREIWSRHEDGPNMHVYETLVNVLRGD